MKLFLVFALAFQQPSTEVALPATLAEARTRLQELSLQERHEEALGLASKLRAAQVLEEAREPARAEALYDVGVASLRAGALDPALEAWGSASGLGGAPAVRLDALYNRGAGLLAAAEQLRMDIPEVRQAAGLPPAHDAPAPQAAPPADPIVVARAAYVRAKEAWVERLRAERGDRATREGLEFIQRRLRELEAIEQERKEQEQEKQQQKEQQEKQQQEKEQQQDPRDQPKQEDKPEKQDPSQQEPAEPKDGAQQPPSEEEPDKQDQQEEQPQATEERSMSAEEMQRLLDLLQEIEEQARQVQVRLQDRRRVPVKRDW